jgi:hypothetical protein
MIYKICIAPIPLEKKPTQSEVAEIKMKFIPTGVTYNQFIDFTAPPKSYTVTPAYITGTTINNDGWASQQVFYLDFDDGISIQDVLDRFKNFGITPNFYYTTFGFTEQHPKFRVGLLINYEIKDGLTAQRIRDGLLKVFPEADKTCRDAARIFFGGKDVYRLTEHPIPYSDLELMVGLVIMEEDHGKTRYVPGRVSLLDYNKDTRFETNQHMEYLSYLKSIKNNKVNFDELAKKVRIFNDFINGVWLHHNQLFGIATSLHWMKGGKKLFNETMEKYNRKGLTNYDKYKFKLIAYASFRGYFPMALEKFSPHEEDHQYSNLLTAIKPPRTQIERIKEQVCIDINVAQTLFEQRFVDALESTDNKIYIFKLPTGFGKTTLLTQLHGHVMAFPTHKLKVEVLGKMAHTSLATPQIPSFNDKSINARIEHCYNLGLNDVVIMELNRVSKLKVGNKPTQDSILAKLYLNDMNNNWGPNTNLLTTHQRLLLGDTDATSVIFDEDPIKELLSVDFTTLDDLILLDAHLPNAFKLGWLIEQLKNAEANMVISMPTVNIPRDVLIATITAKPTKTNVLKFLSSHAFTRMGKIGNKINYIIKRELDSNKKYIIMSATAQVHLYERMYPGRVEVLDLSNIALMGKVHQHTDYSNSRASLTSDRIQEIKAQVGNIPIITFKKSQHEFGDMAQMHFGNVQGYDELNGYDIAVVGTPHLNEVVYRLIAHAVGLNPNIEPEMKRRMVEYGDFRFIFMTYQSKEMQQIQLSLIESELIQAVGRARLLRNKCEVELFSNFPLSFSEFKTD